MKIKVTDKSYDEVMALPRPAHKLPKRPNVLLKALIKVLSGSDMKATSFSYTTSGMDKLGNEPCLILMNHSSFIDLKIAYVIFYPKSFCIVCTSDGFVGKEMLMRELGCIPTQKFVHDVVLVKDMLFALKKLHCSVLMYPEASYSFDGTATPLPEVLGKCLKALKVPVVTITTKGAFARDPLYNGLQLRKVKVSAEVEYLLSPEDIEAKSVEELNTILKNKFTIDNFNWQKEAGIEINESFRADGLNRILYKCCECGAEGHMKGSGITLYCDACGSTHELTPLGELRKIGDTRAKNTKKPGLAAVIGKKTKQAPESETRFIHIPDWYAWERSEVLKEIESGVYRLDIDVDICMMVDYKSIYRVGTGRLIHTSEGFRLTGCDGKIDYVQKPQASYSLYSDYFWYEIGDIICIGDKDKLFYCIPQSGDVVAKTRLAAEELYKICKKS